MVKNKRKGFTFMLLAPIFAAWRMGSLDLINSLSSCR